MLVLLLLFSHCFDRVKKTLTLQKLQLIATVHKEFSACVCAWFPNLQAEEKRLIWGYSSKMEKHVLIQLNGLILFLHLIEDSQR